jgi:hypothetical protein
VAGHNDLYETLVGLCWWTVSVLPTTAVNSDDEGAAIGRQGLPRKCRATPLQLLEPGINADRGDGGATVGRQGTCRQSRATPLTDAAGAPTEHGEWTSETDLVELNPLT